MTIPPAASTSRHPDGRISFVLRLGHALHTSGYAAHRLEEALTLASDRLGLVGQFFSMPTSIMASFGPQDDQQTFLIRVEPSESDLGRLAAVDEVTREVLQGRLTPHDGVRRLEAIHSAPALYGKLSTTIAFGIISASVARFLGGGLHEIVASLGIGLVIGLLALAAARLPALAKVFDPVAAFAASVLASAAAAAGMPLSVFLATLSGVIVLIPGLTLTTAMTELSTRHLASGTARLMGALVLLLGIAFGIAFGNKLAALTMGTIPSAAPTALPEWTLWLSILVSPLAFVVLLKADLRDAPWITVSGILAIGGARVGAQLLGPELGAFGGAFVTALGSNWYARITNRPAQVALVPGLLLLVPGSIGLSSFTALLARQTVLGVESAFKMVLVAVALVSGVLIAGIVSPRRKLLN